MTDHRPRAQVGDDIDDAVDLSAVGDRIEVLLEASSAHGALARERSEELLRLVTDLYGAGLERLLEILYDAGRLDPDVLADLAADDLVASLLLVHGLHPHDLPTRVGAALTSLAPTLAEQQADVVLAGIGADGVIRLRVGGAVSGCGAGPLRQLIEDAVQAVAPDAAGIEIAFAAGEPVPSLIPVSALRSRLREAAS